MMTKETLKESVYFGLIVSEAGGNGAGAVAEGERGRGGRGKGWRELPGNGLGS